MGRANTTMRHPWHQACILFTAFFLWLGQAAAEAQDARNQPMEAGELREKGKLPVARVQAPPQYPDEMSRAGVAGVVMIEFIIDERGDATNARVLQSNNPAFERPALIAVSAWKFNPGEMKGRPVKTRVTQIIEFNLQEVGRAPEAWRVTKGKGHDKLSAEFRWETPPTPKQTRFPVYPFEQLAAGTGGMARVSYIVGPSGRVVGAKIQEATSPEFGGAVLAMIEAWHFEPARKKDGTPCYANLSCEYKFQATGRSEVPVRPEAREILDDVAKRPEAIVGPQELDTPLQPRSRVAPVYPTALRESGQAGEAEVEFFIDRNGDAHLPRVIACTAPEFGYAAAQALATWRFDVPKKAGVPVVVRLRLPVKFPGRAPAESAK